MLAPLGFGFTEKIMQRLTARLLLLFALVGTFVPIALAATAAPIRACCLRKSAHPCHGTAPSEELAIRAMGCCGHNCYRGVTTSQSAHPQQSLTPSFARDIDSNVAELNSNPPATQSFASQSTRAPPAC